MEATLNQFISTFNNKGVDYDGYYGDQCMDLINFWARYLGKPAFTGNAINVPREATNGWRWVANTPEGVPGAGDIVCFNFAPNGHVSIARPGGNTNNFPSFDQNWNGVMRCELVEHDYTHVTGWLTLEQPPAAPTPVAAAPAIEPLSTTVNIVTGCNVRTAPDVNAPIAGSLHVGTCEVTGVTNGGPGTVGTRSSNRWLRTLNAHWFNEGATNGNY